MIGWLLSRGILGALIVFFISSVNAQHEGHKMPAPKPTPRATPSSAPKKEPATPATTPTARPVASPSQTHTHGTPAVTPSPTPDSDTTDHSAATEMGPLLMMHGDDMFIRVGNSSVNLIPMGRMGSGTSWQPESTDMHMLHKQSGEWVLMFHYNALVGINAQGGPRGTTKFESANWFMPEVLRRVGKGTLGLRGMFSFEPFTFARGGSPLLLQTGETFAGQPLIDRQHPHDLFMELSATYTLPLGEKGTWFTYFGYPGEPALGPTAFMHRASASENPSAPLSHHLQDSSHISFGVVTTGFTYRWLKIEGSVFNGREPDENRYDFEANPWNSRSVRLTVAPNRNWSVQVSHGFLRNPEALEPGDVRRTTASISYNRRFDRGNWASSLIWGRNHENHGDEVFHLNGYLAESTVNFLERNYLYTRLELVDKNQLLRDDDRIRLGITDHHPSFRIGAFTFGGARDIWSSEKITAAIGGDVTFYSKPEILTPIYGSHPTSYRLFVRFRPGRMKSDHSGSQH